MKEPADNNNNKNSGASEEGSLVGNGLLVRYYFVYNTNYSLFFFVDVHLLTSFRKKYI